MSGSSPLDELYLNWLYSQVGDVNRRNPAKTFWSILRLLYKKEFVWFVANDDNRVEDGKNLRYDFLRESHIDTVDRNWIEMPCSFLEMLLGLARRLCFEAEGTTDGWFWHLMMTLGLDKYSDRTQIPHDDVEDILNTVIFRTYRQDGQGGLFPLKNNHGRDQREVEIWYQLNAWLLENDA
jgi:hypothetical protein